MKFEVLHKPTFDDQLLALPREHARQVNNKINQVLRVDPRPDGVTKKKLEKYAGNICRLRSGDYRVVYSYGDGWVNLLAVRDRKEVYEDEYFADEVEIDLSDVVDEPEPIAPPDRATSSKPAPRPIQQYLPVKIDTDLLTRLRIPERFHAALTACETEDDLLDAEVSQGYLERVMNVVLRPDLADVLAQPDLTVQEEDDLIRFVEGDLLGFLLKLDAEQEEVVTRAMNGKGPTLVKGGPGTGKSTIALYRVQAIIRALQAEGIREPRVLFTTYTNALVHSSQQLLRRLLGPNARFVEVCTADRVVRGVFHRLQIRRTILHDRELLPLLRQAVGDAARTGNGPGGESPRGALPRVSDEYLLEEINKMIEARELSTLEEYLQAPRSGRRVPLNARQREAIWRVYERFGPLLDSRGVTSYERARLHAATLIRAGAGLKKYDGVVIDEVQDFDPSVLRLLVLLCAAPNRLFITADANQSIYGSSFTWRDVHEDLQFRGRVSVLRTNHRSTRRVGEAAHSYLRNGALDEPSERGYVEEGSFPAVRPAPSPQEEAQLLARFFRQSQRLYHLGYGSCAVLVPTNKTGQAIAERLKAAGIEAAWMTGDDLDLESPTVKVMNLKSAKGLEFPAVALAGFLESPYFGLLFEADPGEREERLLRERRSMFVGMTRAMRSLLVVTPAVSKSPLLQGFDEALWNLGRQSEVVGRGQRVVRT